jgi:head-tail adaptor
MIRSGQFRDRVTIQTDASADGEPTASYTGTHQTRWPCKITVISGQESFRGRQLESGIDYAIEGWHLAGLTADMRIYVTDGLFTGKTLNVQRVQHTAYDRGQPASTLIYCREGDGA